MKKSHIVLIVIVAVIATIGILICSPFTWLFGGLFFEITSGNNVEIEIDSYRLCEDKDGEDVIIIKYLLKNDGKEPTSLFYEGDFYVYQDGVSLTEYVDELPKECNYDLDDQYKDIKGGISYYAEIAYVLEYPDKDVEVEVVDYGLFDENKEKVFTIK
ncbi:MAG: DUF5067 domain-containing protein [Clostridia bacterium]|nr:DUF5067 domain-containing protein [Clostridia bacterium]